MQSQRNETERAEDRFRKAFERLKNDDPKVLKPGTPVTQNNVAREASCDPSALKKARFPALIREIQAYIELHPNGNASAKQRNERARKSNRSITERMNDAISQRDRAQSLLASANMRIVELLEQVQQLNQELNDQRPPPTQLGPI